MNAKNFFLVLFALSVLIACITLIKRGNSFRADVPSWNQTDIPLRVGCRSYNPEIVGSCSTIYLLVRHINDRVGFELFSTGSDGVERVGVLIGVPQGREPDSLPKVGEFASMLSLRGRAVYCQILTSNTGDDMTLFVVAYHGFGECLGLAHDFDNMGSIMRPFQPRGIEDLSPGQLPRFIDADVSAIRKRYLPQ